MPISKHMTLPPNWIGEHPINGVVTNFHGFSTILKT